MLESLRGCWGEEKELREKAEARVAELEDELASASRGEALAYVETLEDRAARAEARAVELEELVETLSGALEAIAEDVAHEVNRSLGIVAVLKPEDDDE